MRNSPGLPPQADFAVESLLRGQASSRRAQQPAPGSVPGPPWSYLPASPFSSWGVGLSVFSIPPCHLVGNLVPFPVGEMEGRGVGRALRTGGSAGRNVRDPARSYALLRGLAAQQSGLTATPSRRSTLGRWDLAERGAPWQLSLRPPESQLCCSLRSGSVSALFALKITPGLRVPAWLFCHAGLDPGTIFILPLHRARGLEKQRSWSLSILAAQSARLLTLKICLVSLAVPPFLPEGLEGAALLHGGSRRGWMSPSGKAIRVSERGYTVLPLQVGFCPISARGRGCPQTRSCAPTRAGFASSTLLPRNRFGSCPGAGRGGGPTAPVMPLAKSRGRRKPGGIWAGRSEGAAGARPEGNGNHLRSPGSGRPRSRNRRGRGGGRIRRPIPARVKGLPGTPERVRVPGAAGAVGERTG